MRSTLSWFPGRSVRSTFLILAGTSVSRKLKAEWWCRIVSDGLDCDGGMIRSRSVGRPAGDARLSTSNTASGFLAPLVLLSSIFHGLVWLRSCEDNAG